MPDFKVRPTVNGTDVALQGEGAGAIAVTTLKADVVSTTTTFANVAALSFAVLAGQTYRFRFTLLVSGATSAVSPKLSLNGPAFSALGYTRTQMDAPGGGGMVGLPLNTYDAIALPPSMALVDGNIFIVEGIIKPTASGTVFLRHASTSPNASTIRAGSTLEVR